MEKVRKKAMTAIYAILIAGLAWEIVFRPVIKLIWPDATLPDSILGEIVRLLLGLMGLGL